MPKDSMTPRERWLAVVRREKPDRIPMYYRATEEAHEKLLEHMGCSRGEMLERLHIDTLCGVGPRYVGPQRPSGEDLYGRRSRIVHYEGGSYSECVHSPLAEFDSVEEDTPEHMATVRETACEQGLFYRENAREMIDRYGGDFVYLQDGEVKWSGPDPSHISSHRDFVGKKPGSALFLKFVDPDEREGERFATYEDCLQHLRAK